MDKEIQTILDCFTGADGGVSFVKLTFFLNEIKDNEEHPARDIKDAIYLIANLITLLQKKRDNS